MLGTPVGHSEAEPSSVEFLRSLFCRSLPSTRLVNSDAQEGEGGNPPGAGFDVAVAPHEAVGKAAAF